MSIRKINIGEYSLRESQGVNLSELDEENPLSLLKKFSEIFAKSPESCDAYNSKSEENCGVLKIRRLPRKESISFISEKSFSITSVYPACGIAMIGSTGCGKSSLMNSVVCWEKSEEKHPVLETGSTISLIGGPIDLTARNSVIFEAYNSKSGEKHRVLETGSTIFLIGGPIDVTARDSGSWEADIFKPVKKYRVRKTGGTIFLIGGPIDVTARDSVIWEAHNSKSGEKHGVLETGTMEDIEDVVKLLLDNGADLEITDNEGATPLLYRSLLNSLDFKQKDWDGHIYLADYSILEVAQSYSGPIPDDLGYSAPPDINNTNADIRYCTEPLALFYVNKDSHLMPIAIQLRQKPGPENPIWTPNEPNKDDWLLAKLWVKLADSNVHQRSLATIGWGILKWQSSAKDLPLASPKIKCPDRNCDVYVEKDFLAVHLRDECKFRKILCPYCLESVMCERIKEHLDVCIFEDRKQSNIWKENVGEVSGETILGCRYEL